jgi:hypothetical protein
MTGRPVRALDISGLMVTGFGTGRRIIMYMSMDIGQDQDPAVHMKKDIGKADLAVNTGPKVGGTEKITRKTGHMIMIMTEGNYQTII